MLMGLRTVQSYRPGKQNPLAPVHAGGRKRGPPRASAWDAAFDMITLMNVVIQIEFSVLKAGSRCPSFLQLRTLTKEIEGCPEEVRGA